MAPQVRPAHLCRSALASVYPGPSTLSRAPCVPFGATISGVHRNKREKQTALPRGFPAWQRASNALGGLRTRRKVAARTRRTVTASPAMPTTTAGSSGSDGSADVLNILIASDIHLGYGEKDPIRGEDSYRTFAEIFQIALEQQARHRHARARRIDTHASMHARMPPPHTKRVGTTHACTGASANGVHGLARQVDMVLLAGDLFHDNKPSRKALQRAMEIMRDYCLGDRPVTMEVVSDQQANFHSKCARSPSTRCSHTTADAPSVARCTRHSRRPCSPPYRKVSNCQL